jgi:hypothetical protein
MGIVRRDTGIVMRKKECNLEVMCKIGGDCGKVRVDGQSLYILIYLE